MIKSIVMIVDDVGNEYHLEDRVKVTYHSVYGYDKTDIGIISKLTDSILVLRDDEYYNETLKRWMFDTVNGAEYIRIGINDIVKIEKIGD